MWFVYRDTGVVLTESFAYYIDAKMGPGAFQSFIDCGLIEQLRNPSVIDILKATNSTLHGIRRYREIHRCSWEEAHKRVGQIIADINRYSKGDKRK